MKIASAKGIRLEVKWSGVKFTSVVNNSGILSISSKAGDYIENANECWNLVVNDDDHQRKVSIIHQRGNVHLDCLRESRIMLDRYSIPPRYMYN